MYLLYTNVINRRKQNLFRIWILYSAFKHYKYNSPPPPLLKDHSSYQARFQMHWYSTEFSLSRDATPLIKPLPPKATPLKSYKVSYLLQKGLPYTQCIWVGLLYLRKNNCKILIFSLGSVVELVIKLIIWLALITCLIPNHIICQKYFFINVWCKIVFNIYFTEFGTALTTILPILFQYCYKYCYSDSRNLWAVMKAGCLAL